MSKIVDVLLINMDSLMVKVKLLILQILYFWFLIDLKFISDFFSQYSHVNLTVRSLDLLSKALIQHKFLESKLSVVLNNTLNVMFVHVWFSVCFQQQVVVLVLDITKLRLNFNCKVSILSQLFEHKSGGVPCFNSTHLLINKFSYVLWEVISFRVFSLNLDLFFYVLVLIITCTFLKGIHDLLASGL